MERTALITGGSGGIGFELAKLFARDGYTLILVARPGDRLERAAAELSATTKVETIGEDLGTHGASQRVLAHLEGRAVDALVNNAGFAGYGLFETEDLDKVEAMIQLNVLALTSLTRQLLPVLIERRGAILNVASTAAYQPGPLMAVYYATKAYVWSFSLALQNELEGRVQVSCLCPGATQTGFQEGAAMTRSKLVQGTLLTAEEVAIAGYIGMRNGTPVVIPGFRHKVLAAIAKISPGTLTAAQVRKMQSEVLH